MQPNSQVTVDELATILTNIKSNGDETFVASKSVTYAGHTIQLRAEGADEDTTKQLLEQKISLISSRLIDTHGTVNILINNNKEALKNVVEGDRIKDSKYLKGMRKILKQEGFYRKDIKKTGNFVVRFFKSISSSISRNAKKASSSVSRLMEKKKVHPDPILREDFTLMEPKVSNADCAGTIAASDPKYRQLKQNLETLQAKQAHASKLSQRFADSAALNAAQKALDKYLKEHTRDNWEAFIATTLNDFPSVRLDPALSTKAVPEAHEMNNNGIRLSENDTVKVSEDPATFKTLSIDGEEVTLEKVTSLTIGEKVYATSNTPCYLDRRDNRIYPSPDCAEYADYSIASKRGKSDNNSPVVITLTDGSSHGEGVRAIAKTTAQVSHAYVEKHVGRCKTLHDMLEVQLKALKKASKAASKLPVPVFPDGEENPRSTTFIQAAVMGGVLTGVVVGDSKVVVFRPREGGGYECIDPLKNLKGSLDVRDPGGQLKGGDNLSDLDLARAFAMPIMTGDIVFAGSDGIFDCVNPEITREEFLDSDEGADGLKFDATNPEHLEEATLYAIRKLERIVRDCANAQEINAAIQAHVQNLTFAGNLARMTGGNDRNMAGKPDDAATAFVEITV